MVKGLFYLLSCYGILEVHLALKLTASFVLIPLFLAENIQTDVTVLFKQLNFTIVFQMCMKDKVIS